MDPDPPASATDPYASARASIRDTTKWLVATFASMATAIVAGMPLSSIGELDLGRPRLWLAVGALAAAVVSLGSGLVTALRLLRPEGLFLSDLRKPASEAASSPELVALRAHIEAHAVDLLPMNFPTVERLQGEIERAQQARQEEIEAAREAKSAAERDQPTKLAAEWATTLAALESRRTTLLQFALYQLLYQRLVDAVPQLMRCGAFALAALLVFVWAANPPHTPAAPTPTHIVFDNSPPPTDSAETPPALEPSR